MKNSSNILCQNCAQSIRPYGPIVCRMDGVPGCEQLLYPLELDQQIESLEADIEFYETSLEHDRELLKQLNTNPEAFETYARENFGMHKEGETVTIIETENSSDE